MAFFPLISAYWYRTIPTWPHLASIVLLVVAVLTAWFFKQESSLVGSTIVVKPKFVMDGNTFYGTTTEGKLLRLRLRLVDAPELDQPYGREARSHLRKLLPHHSSIKALCRVTGMDNTGGLIADVFMLNDTSDTTNMVNLQEEMVRHGSAWAMEGGFTPNNKLRGLMAQAREAKRGLWHDANPVRPRTYRIKTRREFYAPSQTAKFRQRHSIGKKRLRRSR